MLKEENNDFRNTSNQLHETLKRKINDLKEAEERNQYLKEKSKQVFQNEHHNDRPTHLIPRDQMNNGTQMSLKAAILVQQIRFLQTIIVDIDMLIN